MRMLITVMLCALSQLVLAQSCLESIEQTAPDERYLLTSGDAVTDTQTGLMWQRCSLGQNFDTESEQCVGDAQPMTWQQALAAAQGFNSAGFNDWRLPDAKELTSLIERQCVRPAVNTTVFPQTSADDYWSSTPAVSDPLRAWVVAFFNGSNSIRSKQRFVFVRLVRTAD